MRRLEDIELPFEFPVVYWMDGYVGVFDRPADLFLASRSDAKRLESRKCYLLDVNGRRFDITGWEKIEPFGGLETYLHRLLHYVFAVPILVNERKLSVDEAKNTILQAARSQFEFAQECYALSDIEAGLPNAHTYRDAIDVLRKAVEPAS